MKIVSGGIALMLAAVTVVLVVPIVRASAGAAVKSRGDWPQAKGDPFWPAPRVIAPPPIPRVPDLPMVAPPPPPPRFGLLYLGVYESPDGDRVVYFSRGEAIVRAHAGSALGEGFTLATVDESRAVIVHPALEYPIEIAISQP